MVGAAFGEVENPRKNIPSAVRQTLYRIGIFYVISVIAIGMAVPYTDRGLIPHGGHHDVTSSPFVIAVTNAHIKVLPEIINGSLLIFTLSAVNADIYTASRTLFALAKDKQAPAFLTHTRIGGIMDGVPLAAVAIASCFVALAYMNAAKSAQVVFVYLVNLTTVFGALNWVNILISYLFFRNGVKARGIQVSKLPYIGPLQPYGAYYALIVTILIIIFNGKPRPAQRRIPYANQYTGYAAFVPHFDISRFVTSYIGVLAYLMEIFAWKWLHRTRRVKSEDMGLEDAMRKVEASRAEALPGSEKHGFRQRLRERFCSVNVSDGEITTVNDVPLRRSSTKNSVFWPSLRRKEKNPNVSVSEELTSF